MVSNAQKQRRAELMVKIPALYGQMKNQTAVAKLLQTSTKTVLDILQKSGIDRVPRGKSRVHSEALIEQIRSLRNEGKTYNEIKRAIGVSSSTIQKYTGSPAVAERVAARLAARERRRRKRLKSERVQQRRKHTLPRHPQTDEILRLHAEKNNGVRIAAIIGTSSTSVYKVLRRNGIMFEPKKVYYVKKERVKKERVKKEPKPKKIIEPKVKKERLVKVKSQRQIRDYAKQPLIRKVFVEKAELPSHWKTGLHEPMEKPAVIRLTDKIIPSIHDQHRQRWSNY